jgi:F-type H+-transporting ATPase subunit delta
MFVRRYAKALLDMSVAENKEVVVKRDTEMLAQAFSDTKVFGFICDRLVPRAKRIEIFELDQLTAAFLMLVLKNQREEELPLILKEHERLFNVRNKIAEGEAVSRIEISLEQKTKLVANLEKKFEKKVKLSYRVDPSLLGGIYVRLDDKILDGTVTGRLKEMSYRLLEA